MDKRVGRKHYWITLITVSLFYFLLDYLSSLNNPDLNLLKVLLFIIFIPVFLYSLIVVIWRLNDIQKPRWYLVLLLIPIINVVIGVILAFRKGIKETHPADYPAS